MAQDAKYAHTKAFVGQLAREYPLPDSEGSVDEDMLVKKVVRLLEEEDDDGLKALIQSRFAIDDSDPALLEQVVLDLMHKHKDDVQGVPFVFLSPLKRPISRPSSRASYRAPVGRPDTPSSPLAKSLSLRRPHTPLASPLSGGMLGNGVTSGMSPGSSPTIAHAIIPTHLNAGSQPSSPLTSPHFLNAKAVEFRPAQRPGSAMSGTFGRNETPSPDLWAHRPNDIAPNSPRRVSGSLAIASPLGMEGAYYPRPSSSLTRSNSNLRKTIPNMTDKDENGRAPGRIDDEDSNDFSPFTKSGPMNMPKSTASTHLDQFDDGPTAYPYPAHLQTAFQTDEPEELNGHGGPYRPAFFSPETYDPTGAANDGMTPFEVLHSVFGSSVPPATLEEALNKNGYDFEAAMAWLVDNAAGQSPVATPAPVPQSKPVPGTGGRVMTISRDVVRPPGSGPPPSGGNPQYMGQRPAVATGGRVCRYYLAGECRRSDCRFSHDVERALCRFWLRGQCMKGEQCEFLHTLPQDIDTVALTNAMAGTNLNEERQNSGPPLDAFPALQRPSDIPGGSRSHDPSRTRFATAVKKQPMVTVTPNQAVQRTGPVHLGVKRVSGDRSGPATPRPSPRIKLRPPSLLPTLQTGKAMNDLYMAYRAKAIELGGARNVALTRAAEAWKKGDGASAKHFSREANDLNAKMGKETAEAAQKLVQERARTTQEAVLSREISLSNDPMDRAVRGKMAGGGLGICLGVASVNIGGVSVTGSSLSSEERTESLLDLHGLHSSEGVEVLEQFLLSLEEEHFLGLAYVVVGQEKHTGTQDPNRGASRLRLAAGVKEFLHRWQYPWNERDGVVCVDPLTHAS